MTLRHNALVGIPLRPEPEITRGVEVLAFIEIIPVAQSIFLCYFLKQGIVLRVSMANRKYESTTCHKNKKGIDGSLHHKFNIAFEEAEQIKIGAITGSSFPRRKLEEIIAARLSDIFELIDAHLKKIGRNGLHETRRRDLADFFKRGHQLLLDLRSRRPARRID